MDISHYGMVYGGLQKLIGVSGISVCVIARSLLSKCADHLPMMQGYKEMVRYQSMQGTPNVFAWLSLGAMLRWMRRHGGMAQLSRRQSQRAHRVRASLADIPNLQYLAPTPFLSGQNIAFTLGKDSRNKHFLTCAKDLGLLGLEGHAARGGVRINLYHGITDRALERLCEGIAVFAKREQEVGCA